MKSLWFMELRELKSCVTNFNLEYFHISKNTNFLIRNHGYIFVK